MADADGHQRGSPDFEDAYARPVLDEDPAPTGGLAARAPARVAPTTAFALHGCVLTPAQRLDDGYVVVDAGRIVSVSDRRPTDAHVIETDGVILPGLIDLHGHPEYNVFAAWEPPKLYANRGRWRDSREYDAVVKQPWARLKTDPSLIPTASRYAQARALVAGTTAIQGANGSLAGREESLVRNVDRFIFGQHRARSIVDLDRNLPADNARLRSQIDAGEVDTVYIQLAEGVAPTSEHEFAGLVAANLLTAATVIIHGLALSDQDLDDVQAAGAKIVWSPQSNLRLYGKTTPVAEILRRGIPVGLGADWLPSGSPSLFAELRIARRVLREQRVDRQAADLVRMVTSDAASIAGLGDELGTLDAGRAADILVLERHGDDPWENVVAADPSWIELVTIDGDLAYGRPDWLAAISRTDGLEPCLAGGKPMLIDTSYSVRHVDAPPPRLADLRAALIARYPQVGPILA